MQLRALAARLQAIQMRMTPYVPRPIRPSQGQGGRRGPRLRLDPARTRSGPNLDPEMGGGGGSSCEFSLRSHRRPLPT